MTKKKSLTLNKVTVQNLSKIPENHLDRVKGGKEIKTIELTICFFTPNSCNSCIC